MVQKELEIMKRMRMKSMIIKTEKIQQRINSYVNYRNANLLSKNP